jgi:hypothetical protein
VVSRVLPSALLAAKRLLLRTTRALRVCPSPRRQLNAPACVFVGGRTQWATVEGNTLVLKAPATGEVTRLAFDGVLDESASQADVYAAVGAPLVEHVLSGGGDACCVANGPTSGGKSYSLFGEPTGDGRGIGFRAVEALFARVDAVNAAAAVDITAAPPPLAENDGGAENDAAAPAVMTVTLSVVEVYLDALRDLLAAAQPRPASAAPLAVARTSSSSRPGSARPTSARPGSAKLPSPREVRVCCASGCPRRLLGRS